MLGKPPTANTPGTTFGELRSFLLLLFFLSYPSEEDDAKVSHKLGHHGDAPVEETIFVSYNTTLVLATVFDLFYL